MLTNAPIAAVLPITDVARSKKFYMEKLGLKLSPHSEGDMLMFEAGLGTMLLLYKRPSVKVEHTQAGFKVDDLVKVVEELRAKGVVFEEYDFPGLKTVNGIAKTGENKSAWFKDPDGNILAISQM